MSDIAFAGSCACGRITYKCSSIPTGCAACHCVTCRKTGGASYQTFAVIDGDKIIFHDDKTNTTLAGLPETSKDGIEILSLSKIADRVFCFDCHSPFGMRYEHSPTRHSVTLGSVDEESIRDDEVRKALTPEVHIFTTQKAWWCEGIGKDGLRRCERFTGTFEDDIQAWEKANT